MNPPIWPPLSDGIFLAATGMVAAAMLVSSSFTSEHQSRRILGRALERYRSIPEDELAPALENAGKSRFYSLAGIVAVLLCAMAWRLMLYSGAFVVRFGRAQGWPTWIPYLLVVPFAAGMPFLMQWFSRRLIRRRLDRRFADRLTT